MDFKLFAIFLHLFQLTNGNENSVIAYWPFTDLDTFRDFSGNSYVMEKYLGDTSSVVETGEGVDGPESIAIRLASQGGLYSLTPNLFSLNRNFSIILSVKRDSGIEVGPIFEHIVSYPDMSNYGFSLVTNDPPSLYLGENMNVNGTFGPVQQQCNLGSWQRPSIVYNQLSKTMTFYCEKTLLKIEYNVDASTYFAADLPDLGIAIGCRQSPLNPVCVSIFIDCLVILSEILNFDEMDTFDEICKHGGKFNFQIFFKFFRFISFQLRICYRTIIKLFHRKQ